MIVAQALVAAALIFFVITVVKEDLLLPLNKLWMRFGLLLGMIVSPIVLEGNILRTLHTYGYTYAAV